MMQINKIIYKCACKDEFLVWNDYIIKLTIK